MPARLWLKEGIMRSGKRTEWKFSLWGEYQWLCYLSDVNSAWIDLCVMVSFPLHGQSTMAAQITELKAVEPLSPLPVFTVLCWERKDNSWEKDENKWSPYTPPTWKSIFLPPPKSTQTPGGNVLGIDLLSRCEVLWVSLMLHGWGVGTRYWELELQAGVSYIFWDWT